MAHRHVAHPGRKTAIAGGVTAAGLAAIALGAWKMTSDGRETALSAMSIALGLVVAITALVLFLLFLRDFLKANALRRGKHVISRWTLSPAEYAMFRTIDARYAFRRESNAHRARGVDPTAGVEVIFGPDAVSIGSDLHRLTAAGLAQFRSVRLLSSDPPMIEFIFPPVPGPRRKGQRRRPIYLRVPVATDDRLRADRVMRHFQDVHDRPAGRSAGFYRRQSKAGLVGASLCGAAAAAGFLLRARNEEMNQIPLILAVTGTILAIGGMAYALLAWTLKDERPGR